MKYLLLILIPILLFSSCTEDIEKVKDPKAVELKYSEAVKDTMLVLVVDHTIMVFDQTNTHVYTVEQINKRDHENVLFFSVILFSILIITLFGVILNS
jgi:hypothetical protein